MKVIVLIDLSAVRALGDVGGCDAVFAVADVIDGKGRAVYYYSRLEDAEAHELPHWVTFGPLPRPEVGK